MSDIEYIEALLAAYRAGTPLPRSAELHAMAEAAVLAIAQRPPEPIAIWAARLAASVAHLTD